MRKCEECEFGVTAPKVSSIWCHFYPETVKKKQGDWCGKFKAKGETGRERVCACATGSGVPSTQGSTVSGKSGESGCSIGDSGGALGSQAHGETKPMESPRTSKKRRRGK